jgi:hypothetical protein
LLPIIQSFTNATGIQVRVDQLPTVQLLNANADVDLRRFWNSFFLDLSHASVPF